MVYHKSFCMVVSMMQSMLTTTTTMHVTGNISHSDADNIAMTKATLMAGMSTCSKASTSTVTVMTVFMMTMMHSMLPTLMMVVIDVP